MRSQRYIPGIAALLVGSILWAFGPGSASVPAASAQSETESEGEADPNPSGAEEAESQAPSEESSDETEDGADAEAAGESAERAEEGSNETEGGEAASASLASSSPEGADEEFRAELEEFRRTYRRYSNEIGDYQGTIDSLVEAEYEKRKAELQKQFDAEADRLEQMERERRLDAIEEFKAFLERRPNRPKYTPDAMFRLAELYFEKENDEFLLADERYQQEMERYRAGRRPEPPDSPEKDYSQTIDVFTELIGEWPDYRLLDGAYYLTAYCHQQMGDRRKARDLFAELIVRRPHSDFVPEAWVRIGEYHFDRSDSPGEIELAKYAYEQATKYEGSKFYDKALYKLAWSHYRLDNFDQAIRNFEKLVEWRAEEGGDSGSVLRAEAIRYIAVSLAEEDWDLDRQVDDSFVMPRIKKYVGEGKPYEREVLTQLVEFLFERTRHERAASVIRYTLDTYPNHPKNPQLHEKLILALMRPPKKVDEAFEVRRNLSDLYGPESEWYAYQKKHGNEEAVDYGDNLIRENLIQAATWYHEQAQQLKDEARVKQDEQLLAQARERYRKAANAYARFLKRYPNDKDIYRWNFYYADSLYYGAEYDKAYTQYRVVRELDVQNNKFQGDAAFNAIKALEFRIRKLVDRGELPESVVPGGSREEAREAARQQEEREEEQPEEASGEEREEQKKPTIEKKPIPEMVKRYITAMDRYVVLRLDYNESENLDPKFAFNAAKIFYDFEHYDTARERFAWIVDNYPDREEAYLAGSLLLETYRKEENYEELAKWAEKLSGVLKGEQAQAVKQEVREFKLGAMFKSAEQLFDQEKYDKAAAEYVKLVDRAPDHENAPRALNNAAVAYENIKKYESAMKLYKRVYREYPDSELAGYALYRVAVNSERFFEFENAARTYKLFYDEYTGETPEELKAMGFDIQDKRPKALLSAAVLSENLQRYEKAANLYEEFVETYPNNDEAPRAQWQAVESWKKAGDTSAMIAAIEAYNREFGGDSENADRVLEGMMRIAEHYEEQGREERASDQHRAIIDEFEKRGLEPGSKSAYYAAKAQFQLAEQKFQEWDKIKIEGKLERQKELLNKKVEEQQKVATAFKKVWEYKNLEYTLAAGFRVGSLFQYFAESLYDVPIPYDPGTEKYRIYRTQLEDVAIPLEDKAIERYVQTIEKARSEKIVNQWTKKTLEELNKYRPDEYPLYKESRTAKQRETFTGGPLLSEVPQTDAEGGFEDE